LIPVPSVSDISAICGFTLPCIYQILLILRLFVIKNIKSSAATIQSGLARSLPVPSGIEKNEATHQVVVRLSFPMYSTVFLVNIHKLLSVETIPTTGVSKVIASAPVHNQS
jgi:hypothetical protein